MPPIGSTESAVTSQTPYESLLSETDQELASRGAQLMEMLQGSSNHMAETWGTIMGLQTSMLANQANQSMPLMAMAASQPMTVPYSDNGLGAGLAATGTMLTAIGAMAHGSPYGSPYGYFGSMPPGVTYPTESPAPAPSTEQHTETETPHEETTTPTSTTATEPTPTQAVAEAHSETPSATETTVAEAQPPQTATEEPSPPVTEWITFDEGEVVHGSPTATATSTTAT